MRTKSTLFALAGLALGSVSANATVIALNDNAGGSAPNLATYGTQTDFAVDLAGAGTNDYQGNTDWDFVANSVISTPTAIYGTFGGITFSQTSDTGTAIGNASLIAAGPIYDTESWANANAPVTLSLTGLDAGRSYLIQVMSGEARSLDDGIDYIGTVTATTDSDSGNIAYSFGDEGLASGAYNVLTLEISGTENVNINFGATSADRGASFAGILVQSQAIPEPSSTALLGLGGLALALRHRR